MASSTVSLSTTEPVDMAQRDIANSTPLSPCETLVGTPSRPDSIIAGKAPSLIVNNGPSTGRKYLLLIIFCLAQFIDVFNVSSLMSAIPSMSVTLHMNEAEATWVTSAFQLTFSAFLLVSGKISDVFSAKLAFVSGISILGVLAIGTGFVDNKIAFMVLRAFSGIAGSLTIPSSLTLIVRIFTEPAEQARAIAIFGATGAIGNVSGLIIGALFTQYASWRWVFWFAALLALPAAVVGILAIPPQSGTSDKSILSKIKHMDLPGVAALTVAIILFILALTQSASDGWVSAMVLAPLVISVVLVIGFFFYEARLPAAKAAIPSRTWFYPNFAPLFGAALLPYFWWVTVFVVFTRYWQEVYQWSIIMSAVRMLPIGIAGGLMSFSTPLSRWISPKWIIMAGYVGMVVGTVLLALADREDRYWGFAFVGFAIGSAGTMLTYVHSNIGIFKSTPPEIAGTVGAMFNGALQLGSAVGFAIYTSIELSVEERRNDSRGYAGRAAGFWFLLAIIIVASLSILVFYRLDAEKDSGVSEVESKQEVLESSEKISESSSV